MQLGAHEPDGGHHGMGRPETMAQVTRDLSAWRSLPTLKVREAAQLVGVCAKTFEREVMPKLKTIQVGGQRLVTVASLRKWLGEDVAETEIVGKQGISARAARAARKIDERRRTA